MSINFNFIQWMMIFTVVFSNLSMIFGLIFLNHTLSINNETSSYQSYFMIVIGAIGIILFCKYYEKIFYVQVEQK